MEQLVILVIIGLISLVNWVMQKGAEKREAAGTRIVEDARFDAFTNHGPLV